MRIARLRRRRRRSITKKMKFECLFVVVAFERLFQNIGKVSAIICCAERFCLIGINC